MSSDESSSAEEEEVLDLSNQTVVTKYRLAADIANRTLQGVLQRCKAGQDVVQLCAFGDKLIVAQAARVYKSKKVQKGVAFPTCISVNETVCHFSPFPEDTFALKEGDVVKIDLGVHVDGFIAVLAHTTVIQAADAPAISGDLGNLLAAADCAAKVCHRKIKVGLKNSEVTSAVKQVAKDYGVNLLQGVLSHQLKRYVIDGNKVVIQREEHDQKVADATFEANEVYAVDIALCTGDDADAKARQSEGRTTVFKRAVDVNYKLRRKTSRGLLSEVNKNHPTLPFTLRALSNATQAKAGVIECTRHELLHEYPVLRVKDGTLVVHLKFVLLLLPSGSNRVTGHLSNLPKFTSDKTVSDDIAKILATSTKKKRRKKKKKKKKNQPAAAPAETAAPEEAAAPSLPAPSE